MRLTGILDRLTLMQTRMEAWTKAGVYPEWDQFVALTRDVQAVREAVGVLEGLEAQSREERHFLEQVREQTRRDWG